MGAWENRGGGGGADMVVEGERARGESLTWWEPARRNRGNYTTMLKEGRKQEERGRSCKVCTPIPTPPLPLHHNLEIVGEVFITFHTYHTVSS